MNPGEPPVTVGIPAALSSALQERFRGSREETTRRLSIYLPVLDKAGVRDSDAPVLDLGCGPGEWLELLGQHDCAAKGVDLDEELVLHARQMGLDVLHADAVDYLSAQPEGSCAAVTSFHLIEHLPAGRLVELLAQIHRVLRPGGITIIETSNPENHGVGAWHLHLDPTHVAPLPPALLQSLIEQAGFATTWVVRVNADSLGGPLEYVPSDAAYSSQINAAIRVLNNAHDIAPDYAIVAQKDGGMVSIIGSQEIDALCGPGPTDGTSLLGPEAEAATHAAEAKAQEAEARALETEAQLAAVYTSTSWRITRPVRSLKRMTLRHAGRGGPNPPSRQEIEAVAPAADKAPSDFRNLPESAREVLADLQRAFEGRSR